MKLTVVKMLLIGLALAIAVGKSIAQEGYKHEVSRTFQGISAEAVVEVDEGYLCLARGNFPDDGIGEQITVVLVDKETGEELDVDAFHVPDQFLTVPGNQMKQYEGLVHVFAEASRNSMYVYTYDGSTGEYSSYDTIMLTEPGDRFGFSRLQGFQDEGIFDIWFTLINDNLGSRYKSHIIYDVTDKSTEQFDYDLLPESFIEVNQVETDSGYIFFGIVDRRLSVMEVKGEEWDIWSGPEADISMLGEQLVQDGQYVYLSGAHFLPNTISYWVPTLVKYDLVTRSVVWDRKLGFEYYSNFGGTIDNIIPSLVDDDTYLIAAETVWYDSDVDSLYAPATVTKVNSDGEVLWSREYVLYTAHGVYHSLADMEPTADGHYLCYGDTWWVVPPPDGVAGTSNWLFKINEDGYIVGAGGGVSTEDEANAVDGVQLWPNPIQSELYINQDDLTDVTYTFYTSTGQLIDKITLDRPYQSLIVATGHWPSGMLTVAITQRGKLLGSQQLVKM